MGRGKEKLISELHTPHPPLRTVAIVVSLTPFPLHTLFLPLLFPPSKNDRSAKFPPLTLIATGGQKKSPCSSCCDNALTQLTFLSPKKTFPRPNQKLLFLSLYFPDKVMGRGGRRRRGNRQIIFIDRGDLPFNNSPLFLLFLLSHLPSQSCSLSTHVLEKNWTLFGFCKPPKTVCSKDELVG